MENTVRIHRLTSTLEIDLFQGSVCFIQSKFEKIVEQVIELSHNLHKNLQENILNLTQMLRQGNRSSLSLTICQSRFVIKLIR